MYVVDARFVVIAVKFFFLLSCCSLYHSSADFSRHLTTVMSVKSVEVLFVVSIIPTTTFSSSSLVLLPLLFPWLLSSTSSTQKSNNINLIFVPNTGRP